MAEKLLMSSVRGEMDEAELDVVLAVYGQDFYGTRLKAQLLMLPQLIGKHEEQVWINTMTQLTTELQRLPRENLNLFGEVIKLLQLLLVCPASVATAERSFRDLKDA